ncbi:MAG: glycosyltransferase [Acidobacteria bacterium]|nr:glycosyltransferase [Acidobacteriota bacterium]
MTAPAPTRVLRVITRLNIGGPAIQATRLSTSLDAEGFDTLLIHGRLGEGEGDMSYLLADRGSRTQYLDLLQRPIAPWADARATVALYQAMRRFRPHVLHTHMAKAGLLGRVAAVAFNLTHPSSRVRVIHTYHGHVLEGYFSGPTTQLFVALERLLARATDRLIAVSARVREDLLHRYRIGSPPMFTVVPLGLDLDAFAAIDEGTRAEARRALDIAGGIPVITTVGRLTAIKNHPLFLDMAQRIARTRPDAVFLIAGGGELRDQLEAEARRRGLAERVRFLGWRRDLATVYGATDVFVITSKNEGTPVALIEAMASGVPGVSTDVGGVRDVIADATLGRVVRPDDAEALAREVTGLLDNRAAREAIASAARQAAVSRFGVRRLSADIAALYREVLAR